MRKAQQKQNRPTPALPAERSDTPSKPQAFRPPPGRQLTHKTATWVVTNNFHHGTPLAPRINDMGQALWFPGTWVCALSTPEIVIWRKAAFPQSNNQPRKNTGGSGSATWRLPLRR